MNNAILGKVIDLRAQCSSKRKKVTVNLLMERKTGQTWWQVWPEDDNLYKNDPKGETLFNSNISFMSYHLSDRFDITADILSIFVL